MELLRSRSSQFIDPAILNKQRRILSNAETATPITPKISNCYKITYKKRRLKRNKRVNVEQLEERGMERKALLMRNQKKNQE